MDLLAALNLDAPGMEKVKAAAQGATVNWSAVQAAYLDYRRTASPARWKIMPADRPAQPTEKDDALGDEVMAHHIRNGYGFTPAGADMGADFNWTFNPVPKTDPAYTDEWTYCNVSRTEFWQSLASAYWKTGNEKYAVEWPRSCAISRARIRCTTSRCGRAVALAHARRGRAHQHLVAEFLLPFPRQSLVPAGREPGFTSSSTMSTPSCCCMVSTSLAAPATGSRRNAARFTPSARCSRSSAMRRRGARRRSTASRRNSIASCRRTASRRS
ncbi:MAG: heparinase II/III family protein [Verrucomicrobiota bacterium]